MRCPIARYNADVYKRQLKFEIEADWNEAGRGDGPIPVLVYSAPVAGNAKTYMDVPAGVLNRMPRPEDLPALSFAAAAHGARAAFLASDCKYGYRNWDGELSVTLINSANEPDPYPERGIHPVSYTHLHNSKNLKYGVVIGGTASLSSTLRTIDSTLRESAMS